MKIAIIGAGNVGTALGNAWTKRGHEIVFGVRDPESAKARSLTKQFPNAHLLLNGAAAQKAEFIVLATPWQSTEEAVRACGDLQGKTLIDCTNPLKSDFSGLEVGFSTSGAELISEWAHGADVFKAMNQIGARLMDTPSFGGIIKPVMFVCGEGVQKASVILIIDQLGFTVVDAGDLKTARLLEPYGMLWIHLAFTQKVPGDFAFALLAK
ncbi:MAG: 8-hydroxy-5-deazaflavin:NADPH oxidoreductase [Verrucomicrobiota bacterium]|nr:8-hydroxy-5-deazaflavin:NADPH oxidoreductase [Verrucomicrobiota bacterium]